MKPGVHDSLIRVRTPSHLLAQAEEKARREGMTLSEFVRQAVRREVREAA
jgi:predicted DNA binding CopG/RHH family protein